MEWIAFPALGWEFSLDPYLLRDFKIFGLTLNIKWYGLLIAIGFLLAIVYAFRRCKSFGINPDRMIDVVLVSTLIAFIGARLYYVLFSSERDAYFADPITILQVWKGGLGIYGGILFAFISGVVMCRWRKVNTLAMFDLASLGFLIGQGIGRWGNFFNQEAFGANTSLPWGMTGSIIRSGANGVDYDPLSPVHPTFLYESLWCILGFVLLHILSKRAYTFKGKIFAGYLIWYGFGRFWIESLRTDSLYIGAVRVSQLVAILAVLGGVALIIWQRARARQTPADLFEQKDTPADDVGDDPKEE
ncbi:MAG: prolipoprotein diacylglyceryl transferase [Acutalibacteraceae bacterium]|jgi:phosphatidylglycerol:prolipoprotein diacylglycerol transferase